MKRKFALLMLLAFQASFGLSAPYLYSADSVGAGKVQLTWRNNATDYVGIVVLRKPGLTAQFAAVDTAAGTATTFTDAAVPGSATPYVYALTAYSQTAHADTSNTDTVTMAPTKVPDIFVEPQNLTVSYDTVTRVVNLQFYDSSTAETGYRIFRSTNFAASKMIKDIVSSAPAQKGEILCTDSAVSPNTWYLYYAIAYNSQQTLSSLSDTLFTFDAGAMAQGASRKCILSSNLSTFPITYKGWSLKSGDTIVLNETGAPDSTTFSIIDISNPSAPKFAGTGKSSAAILGRASVSQGANIFGIPYGDSLFCYQYATGQIKVISSKIVPTLTNGFRCPAEFFPGFLTNSLFATAGEINFGIGGWIYLITAYSFNNNVLSFVDTALISNGGRFNAFAITNGRACNGRYFFNALLSTAYPPPDSIFEIVDFGLSPKAKTVIYHHAQVDIPLLINGILVDAPPLESANNIFIDTVKNLVVAVSDSQLSIFSCQLQVGTMRGISLPFSSRQRIRMTGGPGGAASLILLPRHAKPVELTIFNASGKRVQVFSGIQGESVEWNPGNRTGVFLVKALIDNRLYTARFVLSR